MFRTQTLRGGGDFPQLLNMRTWLLLPTSPETSRSVGAESAMCQEPNCLKTTKLPLLNSCSPPALPHLQPVQILLLRQPRPRVSSARPGWVRKSPTPAQGHSSGKLVKYDDESLPLHQTETNWHFSKKNLRLFTMELEEIIKVHTPAFSLDNEALPNVICDGCRVAMLYLHKVYIFLDIFWFALIFEIILVISIVFYQCFFI